MLTFRVNDFIILKLEGEETNIYINGQYFRQCKFLLLNIPVSKIRSLDEIDSIDEAAEKLDPSLHPNIDENGKIHRVERIPPEVEFWGHCSNLQVWYEAEYDTRLLHSNIAFPLLKKLSESGDPLAKRVFKYELLKRLESQHPTVMMNLILSGTMKYLDDEELLALFGEPPTYITKILINLLKHEFIEVFLKGYKKYGIQFVLFKKKKKAFPTISILVRLYKISLEHTLNLLKTLVLNGDLYTFLYLKTWGIFDIIDYEDFTDELKYTIARELLKGIESFDKYIFNLSIYNLTFISFGKYIRRIGNTGTEIKLNNHLNLEEHIKKDGFKENIRNIILKLIKFYDKDNFIYNFDAFVDFFSYFGHYITDGLNYLLENGTYELKVVAEKSLVKIKVQDKSESIDVDEYIKIETLGDLSKKQLLELIPNDTGTVIVEKLVDQLFEVYQPDRWYRAHLEFFEMLGKYWEIPLGEGVSKVLRKNNNKLINILIELEILEHLTPDECASIVENFSSDLLKRFLIVLDDPKKSNYTYIAQISLFFEKTIGKLPKSLENQLINILDEDLLDFYRNVIKFNVISNPTVKDFVNLVNCKITSEKISNSFFFHPFFEKLVKESNIIKQSFNIIFKEENYNAIRNLIETDIVHKVSKEDLIPIVTSKEYNILEIIQQTYRQFPIKKSMKSIINLFKEVEEIANINTTYKDYSNKKEILNDLVEKKQLEYLDRKEFWALFPPEAKNLEPIEDILDLKCQYYPKYIRFRSNQNDLGFCIKDDHVCHVSVAYCKLQDTQFEEILKYLIKLSYLEILHLNHNQITTIPEELCELTTLKALKLSYDKFTSLPESIGNLILLERLEVNYNHLTALPFSIGKLRNLKLLFLNNINKIEVLPDSIGNLESLETLSLSGNKLEYLPNSICNLKSLQSLSLDGNPIVELPVLFGNLKSLKSLNLSKTNIVYLPDSMSKMNSLETIHVSETLRNHFSDLRDLLKPLKGKNIEIAFGFSLQKTPLENIFQGRAYF